MEYQTRKNLNQVLIHLPQIEKQLTETQEMIVNYLKTRKTPTIPKTISQALGIDYNSTRARLSELMILGYVFQPNKTKLTIAQLDETGTARKFNPGLKKCGYSLINSGN